MPPMSAPDAPPAPRKIAVPLPPGLVKAAADAFEIVEDAERNGELAPGDDQIQTGDGWLCGGADDDDAGTSFEFTAHPPDGTRWDLPLARFELEELADGFPPELTLWECSREGCGWRFTRKRRAERHAADCRG